MTTIGHSEIERSITFDLAGLLTMPLRQRMEARRFEAARLTVAGAIEAVTVESTQAAARALLGRSRPAIAGLGPGRGLDHAAEIVENFARAAA